MRKEFEMPPKVNLQVKLRAVELYGKEKNIVNVTKIINGEFNLTIRRWLINKNQYYNDRPRIWRYFSLILDSSHLETVFYIGWSFCLIFDYLSELEQAESEILREEINFEEEGEEILESQEEPEAQEEPEEQEEPAITEETDNLDLEKIESFFKKP